MYETFYDSLEALFGQKIHIYNAGILIDLLEY